MPTTSFYVDSQNVMRSVDIVFQVFAKAGYLHDGLFPAVAERQNGNLLMDMPLPPPIPGQRNSDRSPRGCNLSHDIPLLATLDGMGYESGKKADGYRLMREQYLQTFATKCAPASPTGLLPWGEHSYWNLHLQTIGNSYLLQYGERPLDAGIPTHHQLGPLPLRDWQVIHAANPTVLPRFVQGLDWHWDNEERTKFNRHAPITQFIRGYQVKRGERLSGIPQNGSGGSDFPASAGTFIHNYACALALVDNPDSQWKDDLISFSDYWWERRLANGLLPKSSSRDALAWNGMSLGMTRSFANDLIEASEILGDADPELSQALKDRGYSFLHAVLDTTQDRLNEGRYCTNCESDGTPSSYSPVWAGNRGASITAKEIIPLLKYGDHRAEDIAIEAGRTYQTSFLPRDTIVRAGDMGAVLSLMGELYRITGSDEWLQAALHHATDAMELFFDAPLPRMAHGRSHYEAQQGSSVLVHSLARLAFISEGKSLQGGLSQALS